MATAKDQSAQATEARERDQEEQRQQQRAEALRQDRNATEQARMAAADDDPNFPPSTRDPYPTYDMMPLAELEEIARAKGVTIPDDVLKSHYITELRAHDSGARGPALRA